MSTKDCTKQPTSRQLLGKRGEYLACQALIQAGYTIVQTDVRVPRGQIDILAREGEEIVFVEVKTRRTLDYGTPLEAITLTKQQHMRRAALSYLKQHNLLDHSWRIDVVGITLTHGPPHIEIVRYAIGDKEDL